MRSVWYQIINLSFSEMGDQYGELALNKISIATQSLYRIVTAKGIIGLIVLPEENKYTKFRNNWISGYQEINS